jgi:arylsulfatase A-like enzyme
MRCWFFTVTLTGTFFGNTLYSTAGDLPNIVFLLTDQWRASATGYAGDPNVRTPSIDRLAVESVSFSNAVSVCAVCTPYRASLMTGRFPTSTGMFLNDAYLPPQELSIAEALNAAGYMTGYIGKWHLDGHGRRSYIPPDRRQGWQYWRAAECDHNYRHSHFYSGGSDEIRYWEGYDAFAQTRDAQEFIREHAAQDAPFALMVSFGGPHFPHETAPDEYKALYPPEDIILPPNVPDSLQNVARREAQGYYAHCTAIDKCVGDILSTLEETGEGSNTIVVFTSDHGETLGSHGVIPRNKQVPWNESVCVPFLIRYPQAHEATGATVRTPITTPDIFPTLFGLAHLPVPAVVEGEDLSGIVRGDTVQYERAALFMAVSPFSLPMEHRRAYRAIRTERYTYVRDLEGPWLLYDNVKDPYQMKNLLQNTDFNSVAAVMDVRLQQELIEIGDDFRPGTAYIEEWGFEIGAHGSVPYRGDHVQPQMPERSGGMD